MVVLVGVIVGYMLAYAPRIVSFFVNRRTATNKKVTEPTAEEQRKIKKAAKGYQNFLSYNGDEQENL